MESSYAQLYRKLDREHWWWLARKGAILDLLRHRIPANGQAEILDIGCGDGLFFDQLLQFGNVEGVEPCSDLVAPDSPHRHRIHVSPFDDRFQPRKHYSLILLLDVLEHVINPVDTLRHSLGLLAPNGMILITVPAFHILWTNHDIMNHHFTRYTKSSFRAVAEKAGLTVREERYWFQWTFPAKLVQRARESLLCLKPSNPKIPIAPINRILYRLSKLELAVANRVSIPFGSSLVVLGGRTD